MSVVPNSNVGFWCFNFQTQPQYINTPYRISIFYKNMNWNALHPLNAKHCLIYLLNVNLKRFWNKILFVPSWPWPCIAHSIYLLEKRKKMNPTIERGKILIPFIILGTRPTSTPSPKRNQLVQWWWAKKV
jgi:hypothetical protein